MTSELPAAIVYLLCLATSAGCAFLLVRNYLATRARLILWTASCFVLLTFNNLFLFMDVVLFPSLDFAPARNFASFGAVTVLLIGFIWDAD